MKLNDVEEILKRAEFKKGFADLKTIVQKIAEDIKSTGATVEEAFLYFQGTISNGVMSPYCALIYYWINEVYGRDTE